MTEAKQNGWIVISMKNDWKQIFAFDALAPGRNDVSHFGVDELMLGFALTGWDYITFLASCS